MISYHECTKCAKFEKCKFKDDYIEYVDRMIKEHAHDDIPKNVIIPLECAFWEHERFKKFISNENHKDRRERVNAIDL